MTSAVGSATGVASSPTPTERLRSRLDADGKAGLVRPPDAAALARTLGNNAATIDQTMTASGADKPDDLRGRIARLIARETTAGGLSTTQAVELQSIFDATFPANEAGGKPAARAAPKAAAGSDGSWKPQHVSSGYSDPFAEFDAIAAGDDVASPDDGSSSRTSSRGASSTYRANAAGFDAGIASALSTEA